MSSELAINQETIQKIVAELSESIDLLATRQRGLVKVGGQAFGASPGGTSAHKAANRAHEALDETLDLLRTAHTEFTESLRVLNAKLQQTDELSRADLARIQDRTEHNAAVTAANAADERDAAAAQEVQS